jgi:hypothetical protein
MPLTNIVLFPYVPKEIYDEYKLEFATSVQNLKSLSKNLTTLFKNSQNGNRLAQLILFDLYLSINHSAIFKENITGKRIEQKFSYLFALSTGDEHKKVNPDISKLLKEDEIKMFDKKSLDLVCSNYRDKGDLFFFDSKSNSLYKLSIKSLIPKNLEINFGSFEFLSTFYNMKGLENLTVQERKRTIDLEHNGVPFKGVGIGSAKQLSSLIDYIKAKNLFTEYMERFKILLRGVYKDDFLIYIKHNNKFEIYLLQNEAFLDIVFEKVINKFTKTRYENNAIRISDLDLFKSKSIVKFNSDLRDAIPDFDEIEKIMLDNNHSKFLLLRKFISS